MARKFRKVYIVCENNEVMGKMLQVSIFRDRDYAEQICKQKQELAVADQQKLWNANKPMPRVKVHGFYLVHEDMFKH